MNTQAPDAATSASFASASRLAAARAGDQHEFSNLVEPSRRELQVHSYRMLGSLFEAEDAVQETFLRAWRRLETYQRDVSFRAWLYKIATNVCLDMLDKRRARRRLPVGANPAADPLLPMPAPVTEPVWLEPVPDDWLAAVEQSTNPEARQAARDNISLAFVAALQRLPPRQRAVLILRDVLDWSANEAAELFGLTPSAVTSALHRARVKLAQTEAAGLGRAAPAPLDPDRTLLLARYVTAWEAADVAGLVQLPRKKPPSACRPGPPGIRAALPFSNSSWPTCSARLSLARPACCRSASMLARALRCITRCPAETAIALSPCRPCSLTRAPARLLISSTSSTPRSSPLSACRLRFCSNAARFPQLLRARLTVIRNPAE